MFKKLLSFLAIGMLFFTIPTAVKSAENITRVYFFNGKGCPHCAEEEYFLKSLKAEYPNMVIMDFEVWYSQENQKLLQQAADKLGTKTGGVPFTVIGDQYMSGYSSQTGEEIKYNLNYCSKYYCEDVVGKIIGLVADDTAQDIIKTDEKNTSSSTNKISLPVFGEINLKVVSLPVLTLMIGLVDGFNPCAMWTLIFLISLLLGIDDKRRRWILGSTFIIVSATVYYLFMTAWLNLFLFIGVIFWVRLLIGVVAISAGGYNLRDYFVNKNGACKVTKNEDRKKVFDKLKLIVQEKSFWLAFGGIILLAFAVNMVELICSAGFPAVYIQVLTLSELPAWQYYFYILGYVFFFMLDDMIIFFVAMATMHMTGLSGKYSRYSNLIGGLLMLTLGIILILKPELLMFG